MADNLITGIVSIGMALIGVAIIATLVSQRAATANVLTAAGNAFGNAIGAAVSPVTGGFGGFQRPFSTM